MNKAFILHLKEPECKPCLIGTWYDSLLEAAAAAIRGEDTIHTDIEYIREYLLHELFEAGYNVWIMDKSGNLVKLLP